MQFEMAEEQDSCFRATPWVNQFLNLGIQSYKFCFETNGIRPNEQLIIAVSIPVRDFGSVLIATGWMMKAFKPSSASVQVSLESIRSGSFVRMATKDYIVVGKLLRPAVDRLSVDGRTFKTSVVKAITPVDETERTGKYDLPPVPPFGPFINSEQAWISYLCNPPQGLTLVGSKSKFKDEFETLITSNNDTNSIIRLGSIVLPKLEEKTATATTRLFASEELTQIDDTHKCKTAIFDGTSAIHQLDEIDCPLAITILDQSVINEKATDFLIQKRNTRGTPISLEKEMSWKPTEGVRALAFKVPR